MLNSFLDIKSIEICYLYEKIKIVFRQPCGLIFVYGCDMCIYICICVYSLIPGYIVTMASVFILKSIFFFYSPISLKEKNLIFIICSWFRTATGTAYPAAQTGYAVAPAATAATYTTQRTGYDQAYHQAAATQGTYASKYLYSLFFVFGFILRFWVSQNFDFQVLFYDSTCVTHWWVTADFHLNAVCTGGSQVGISHVSKHLFWWWQSVLKKTLFSQCRRYFLKNLWCTNIYLRLRIIKVIF